MQMGGSHNIIDSDNVDVNITIFHKPVYTQNIKYQVQYCKSIHRMYIVVFMHQGLKQYIEVDFHFFQLTRLIDNTLCSRRFLLIITPHLRRVWLLVIP